MQRTLTENPVVHDYHTVVRVRIHDAELLEIKSLEAEPSSLVEQSLASRIAKEGLEAASQKLVVEFLEFDKDFRNTDFLEPFLKVVKAHRGTENMATFSELKIPTFRNFVVLQVFLEIQKACGFVVLYQPFIFLE